MTVTLRQFFDELPEEWKDKSCAGVAVILATKDKPHVLRTMEEGSFIALCQIVTHGRAVDLGKVS
jgi:hypothetical protein